MAGIKEREVKGRTYLYVYSSASFKGEKKVFEKSIGPKDGDKEEIERKKNLYSALLDFKKELYLIHLEAKNVEFQHLPGGYAFPLVFARRLYHLFLAKKYPSDLEKYKEEFEIRYVHSTTTIEGNTLTLKETAMVLDRGVTPKAKELREIYEVENYKKLRVYVNDYTGDINLKFLCKLHEFIQRNIDDDSAGQLRRIVVGIAGSKWEPPPAIAVEDELDDLLVWYDENRRLMNPLELAGIFHHRFLQMHPFKDGNGRVAREILNFILERNNYPPIVVPISSRLEYFELLSNADNGNVAPLLEFFATCIMEDWAKAISALLNDELFSALGKSMKELSDSERSEILQLVIWYWDLIKEHLQEIPKELDNKMKDKIGNQKMQSQILTQLGPEK
jgi:fido (protein-threonine AMPylation protein)